MTVVCRPGGDDDRRLRIERSQDVDGVLAVAVRPQRPSPPHSVSASRSPNTGGASDVDIGAFAHRHPETRERIQPAWWLKDLSHATRLKAIPQLEQLIVTRPAH